MRLSRRTISTYALATPDQQPNGWPASPPKRPLTLAALWLALICATSFPSAAAEGLDTSVLPRVAGAKELYASPLSTIYSAPDPVAQAAEAVGKALSAEGWRQFSQPYAEEAKNANVHVMNFKKGPLIVDVLITVSDQPATANVSYRATPPANDLPFPPDATDIAFDPHAPILLCASGQSVAATLEFFNVQLAALGWSPVATRQNANTEKAAHAYFARPAHAPLLLVLKRGDDGATKIELKSVPAELLAAETEPAKPAAIAATPAPAPEATPDAVDAAVAQQAQQMAADIVAKAMADAKAPKAGSQSTANETVETLSPLDGVKAAIPLPSTAEDVKFDGAEGRLSFESASSIKSVVAFYRAAMKPLGWQAEPSGIDKANMVVLDFSKDRKEIELIIMRPIDKTNVDGTGNGLVTEVEKSAAEPTASADDLEVEETGGLPVPKNHTVSGAETTPFRRALNAETPLDLKSVLGFYRQELGKRGWKEEATGARVDADRATLNFTSPDGPAILTLERKDDETVVSLVVRNQVKAASSGLLAKPGQVKAMFGNLTGAQATFTINKQTVKVAPGVGANGPGGPTLELPPGKYKVTMKAAGQPAVTEEVNVGADEIWGFVAGPGGLMPIQIH